MFLVECTKYVFSLTILAWTKSRLVTKHILSNTFQFIFFLFAIKILFIPKSCLTRIICYLFIRLWVWLNIEGAFVKVTNCVLLARVWEWRQINEFFRKEWLSWSKKWREKRAAGKLWKSNLYRLSFKIFKLNLMEAYISTLSLLILTD